jgi:hypothetical protein
MLHEGSSALSLLLLPFLLACGQDATPVFQSSSREVMLDVVITDKHGHTVRDQGPDAFRII